MTITNLYAKISNDITVLNKISHYNLITMGDNKKLLGKKIKEIRKHFGYTQEQLSELIGIETSSLSGIESGRFFPSLHVLDKMSGVLNIELVEFFKFIEIPLPDDMPKHVSELVSQLSDENQKIIYKIIKSGFNAI